MPAPSHRSLLCIAAAAVGTSCLPACSVEQVFDLLTSGVAACLEEGGCGGEASGTPLSQWTPPDLYVVSELTGIQGNPLLSISLNPRELPPFCPDVEGGIEAIVDGHLLPAAEVAEDVGCNRLSWQLGPEAWPSEHLDESTVEITDGESSFILAVPFSLTRPPTPVLDTETVQPGDILVVQVALPLVDQHLIGPAQVQALMQEPKPDPMTVNLEVEDDTIRLQLPIELGPGPATIAIPYQVQTERSCDNTAICRASLYGELKLDIEVVAP